MPSTHCAARLLHLHTRVSTSASLPRQFLLFSPQKQRRRAFHFSARLDVTKPFLLADIGEGITECQLIQWFVQPGARVEQFDKICEVQSDKASVEITSPFDGVIKKLYYEPDDMAITGKPLVDIDIQGEISEQDAQKLAGGAEGVEDQTARKDVEEKGQEVKEAERELESEDMAEIPTPPPSSQPEGGEQRSTPAASSRRPRSANNTHGSLATPAVRHLVREHKVDINEIRGTGKDGRVVKEDVHRHVSEQSQPQHTSSSVPTTPGSAPMREDKKVSLTAVQSQMFKTMTKSLNIPHFLYTCVADMTAVTDMRKSLNAKASQEHRLTHLPFILKALSLALHYHPLLNSSLDTSDAQKPQLTHRGAHHIGVAIDAPAGLVVPVLKNVQDLSITEIAAGLRGLSDKARNNRLAPGDISGATFTVSNIGSVGGGVVAPVISAPQVAILGIGRSKLVPAFDENEEMIKREELVLSWSADHRVVDGAECARCAERVKGYLEDPAAMIVGMR